jgi:hypothetical protein
MRKFVPLLVLLAAACGDSVKQDELRNTLSTDESGPDRAEPGTLPVRVGELGPNFSACALVGTARRVDASTGEPLEVRAAPYDNASMSGTIPPDARFFICTRSLDQKWLGIVFDETGTLSPQCGVSRPLARRSNYDGPCRSGWVSAVLVKQIAG